RSQRIIAELVVVAVVAHLRRKRRIQLEIRLPIVGEERVLRGKTRFNGGRLLSDSRESDEERDSERRKRAHSPRVSPRFESRGNGTDAANFGVTATVFGGKVIRRGPSTSACA